MVKVRTHELVEVNEELKSQRDQSTNHQTVLEESVEKRTKELQKAKAEAAQANLGKSSFGM